MFHINYAKHPYMFRQIPEYSAFFLQLDMAEGVKVSVRKILRKRVKRKEGALKYIELMKEEERYIEEIFV